MQESMKADINQLKNQVAGIDQLKNQVERIYEMMITLKDAVAAQNDEAQSSHPPIFQQGTLQTQNLNQGNRTNQEFPLFGLPLNYEPPYKKGVEQETIPQVVNAGSAKG